jgi:NAD+ synthetase
MTTDAPHLVHLAVAQFEPKKADYAANLARLRTLFAEADALDPRPALLCLPETALTGYFLEGGVREVAMTAGALARDLDAAYRAVVPSGRALDVAIGFYEVWRNRLFNSAMYVTLGGDPGPLVRHVHRKVFLPTYGMFDEERFVERGRDIRAFETPWGRAAMLVCEDAWHSVTGTIAALDGAQLLIVPTAPPARGPWPKRDGVPGPASASRWERLARDMAEEHGVFVVLAHLVGSEGGKLFPGGSMVAGPSGDVRARGPVWEEALVTCALDLRDVTRARADMPLVADLEVTLPHLLQSLDRVTRGEVHAAPTPTCPYPLEIDPALTERWLVHFIRQEMARRDFENVVVGVSGGVDSAVVAYLAARALGPEHVHGIRMPYRTSSPDSLAHGQLVIDALGIRGRTVDISAAVDGYLAEEPDADGTRRGNVMARLRMITLFDLSSKYRAIPLGTGNKTERLFGYFTWHADDSPPINPLGDLFKTQVWALARHLGVPEVIVGKPPSADLVVGQTDEGDFGISYAKADEILNWLLSGVSAEQLVERGMDREEVALVVRRLATTHWKRRLPTVALMSPTAIGESYLRPVDY